MINKSTAAKLDWIQALRGIAALLVVLCHARQYLSQQTYTPWIESLLLPGAMGVDLFFIISGFIMIYSTRNSDGSTTYALNFAIKRFCRIWPVYAAATIIYIVSTNQLTAFINGTASIASFFKSIFFIPVNGLRALFFEPILPLGWTLDFEMYFYAIFAVALLFGRFRLLALSIWIACTVIILPAMTHGFSIDPLISYEFQAHYLNLIASPIILEFLAGALIAKLYLATWTTIKSKIVAWNLVASSVCFMIWYNYSILGVLHGPAQWGASLSLMVLAMAIASKTVTIHAPKFLVWIGEISFSLYLTHLSTRVLLDNVVLPLGGSAMMSSWSYILLTTVISIAVAGVVHKYLEIGLSEIIREKIVACISRLQHSRQPVTI